MSPAKALILTCLYLATSVFSFPADAQTTESETEISEMRALLYALSNRLDALEASNAELKQENHRMQKSGVESGQKIAQMKDATPASSWVNRISLKGDFRQRYENIDEQGMDERNLNRIRARASIIADINENFKVGLGIASGGESPVSSNQTLGGGGSSKGINLDLAYFKWQGLLNTTVYGGKFKNFLFKPGKHNLLWDTDWNPEGLGLVWNNNGHFVNVMGTWLEGDSAHGTEFSYGLQGGFRNEFANDMQLTAGIGYYSIGTSGKGSFFEDGDDFFGNSFDPNSNSYIFDYQELEVFADLSFKLNGRSANVFFDYVQNLDADKFDTGYAAGFRYGSTKSEGDWKFAYIYQHLEADAAFGLLVDSDFAGGGTDGKGHILKGSFAIARNIKAKITYMRTERNGNLETARDYNRLQLDLDLKY